MLVKSTLGGNPIKLLKCVMTEENNHFCKTNESFIIKHIGYMCSCVYITNAQGILVKM